MCAIAVFLSCISFMIIIPLSTSTESTFDEILITPEDVRFALNRCENDTIRSQMSSSTNFNYTYCKSKWIWTPWRIPVNQMTHCFIKCFLMKLGLIDLKHRGLNEKKILNQINLREGINSNNNNDDDDDDDNHYVNENDINELSSIIKGPLDGTCITYHNKWLEIFENYGYIVRMAFYGHQKDIIKFYQKNHYSAKKLGEKAIDFCNNNILHLKKYMISDLIWSPFESQFYKCYLKCIFKHLRYFDAYGRIDSNEIQQSAEALNLLDPHNSKHINYCVHLANQLFLQGLCEVALELNKCLQSKVFGAKEIIEYRNEISQFY